MKRVLSFVLAILILVLSTSLCALPAEAAETEDIIYFDDGSYAVITMEIENSLARTTNSISGSKSYHYYSSSGILAWVLNIQATFSYDGTNRAQCKDAKATVTVYNSNYTVVTKYATFSGNTATATATIKRTTLGVTASEKDYSVTVTCDKDGNLS